MRKLGWLTLKTTASNRLEVSTRSLSLHNMWSFEHLFALELRPSWIFTFCGAGLFRTRVMGLIGLQ
jgi:hypothetical protein